MRILIVLLLALLTGCAVNAPPRPNIVFILADDLGYGDLGCYGQKLIQTPHIDRLASEGVRFTQAYAGSTVCAPSRAALITGQHTGHTRIRGNLRIPRSAEDPSVAEVLQSAGYRTALFGKWGLGEAGTTGVPTRKGFDSFYGYLNQGHAHNSWPTFLVRDEQRVPLRNVVPEELPDGKGVATQRIDYSNHLIHDELLRYIDQQDRTQPFFIYAAYTLPHANNEGQAIEVPDLGFYAHQDWPEVQKRYAAAVTLLDRYVGEIIQRLKQRGLDQNTLVIFTSDNGTHREGGNDPAFFQSSGPLRGIKRDLYEGGIRVPMIARWPARIAAGRISEHVWAFWDFLPTAAELSGAACPDHIDGISIMPKLLNRPGQQHHEYLYWEFHEGGFSQAVRIGNLKGVRLGPNLPIELYDLSRDQSESNNIATDHPGVVARITELMSLARSESEHWPVQP
jgi:arylsulfatase A-like enzyme